MSLYKRDIITTNISVVHESVFHVIYESVYHVKREEVYFYYTRRRAINISQKYLLTVINKHFHYKIMCERCITYIFLSYMERYFTSHKKYLII